MGGGVRATVLDTTSAAPAAPAAPVASSKNADLAAIYMTLALARSQTRAWHPMGLHGAQWVPIGSKWTPIGAQFDYRKKIFFLYKKKIFFLYKKKIFFL